MVNIALTSSMKNNLLSLQSIANQQKLVQNKLATGLKVSSAIDNPSSYYTAQSLNNRARDLSALLDTMSQGIQTLKTVSETIAYATKFLEQAKAVANQALENVQPVVARVSNEADLQAAIASGARGLIVIEQDIAMATNSNIVLKDGQSLVGAKYIDKTARQTSISFNFDGVLKSAIEVGNDSTVSDLNIKGSTNMTASSSVIYGKNKTNIVLKNINIGLDSSGRTPEIYKFFSGISHGEYTVKGYLNINDTAALNASGANTGINNATITAVDNAIINIQLKGQFSIGTTYSIINLHDKSNINIFSRGSGNSYGILEGTFNIYDEGRANIKNASSSGAEHASFNLYSANSVLAIDADRNTWWSSLDDMRISTVTGATIITKAGTYIANKNSGILKLVTGEAPPLGYYDVDTSKKIANYVTIQDMFTNFDKHMKDSTDKPLDEDKVDVAKESKQYNTILNQFDHIINDSSYKGINLLLGHNLKINFNEDKSSKLEILGVDTSAKGLKLKSAAWKNQGDVETSISELDNAIANLRQHATKFGNYYSIVSNREEFTKNIVNVLTEGADKLTLADMNQESANMLALQTAQSLAINSLSLASQASQSVLKLF